MTGTESNIERADQLIDQLNADAMSVDMQSLVATYKRAVADKDERKVAAFAQAIVKRADLDGVTPAEQLTVPELKAEIKARNEGRDDDVRIKPASQKRADLEAALADDETG